VALALSAALAGARVAIAWLPGNARLARYPAFVAPPAEEWPELELVVDSSLQCPTPVSWQTASHLGNEAAPYEFCCLLDLVARCDDSGPRSIQVRSGDMFAGEAFEFAFSDTDRDRVRAMGGWFVDMSPTSEPVQGLYGSVIVNTLEWRPGDAIQVRFELGYFYDDDVTNWSTIEVCGEAQVTIDD
jgi:hypothetical protein